MRLLAERGADLEHHGGETWRKPSGCAPPTSTRSCAGATDVAAALEELGARTDVEFDDLAIAAIARGERPPVVPTDLDWDQQEVIMLAEALPLVIELYGPDFKGVIGGSPVVSLVSIASWLGDVERVRALLAAGAVVRTGWAPWSAARGRVEIAELLVAAGAVIEPEHVEHADGPLAEWLAARRPR